MSAQVVSEFGDTLDVTDVVTSDIFGTPPNESVDCNQNVMFGGKRHSGCATIWVYDALSADHSAPPNGGSTMRVFDACGQQVYFKTWLNWYTLGTNPPRLTSPTLIPAGGDWTVPLGACFGQWIATVSFTVTFTSGATVTATGGTTFPAFPSEAAAELAAQQQPAGGPVGPNEQLGNCGSGHTTHAQATDYPVDTATGNFWHTFSDLSIPGRGPRFDLSRSYNSLAAANDSPFGYGWTDSYNARLDISTTTVVVHQCSGAQTVFTRAGTAWVAPPRVLATLVANGDGTWTFTRGGSEINVFDGAGRLTALTDPNGYATTVAYPDASTRVVTDPSGRAVTFRFTGSHITSVTDSSSPPRTLSYGYDAAGNLTDVIDVGAGHWQFTYDSAHRLLTMRTPRFYGDTTTTPSPVVTNHYDGQGRIDWQSDHLGRTTTLDYTSIPNSTKVTDPKGNVSVYEYAHGLLVSEAHGYGTSTAAYWTYRYDPSTLGRVITIDPNGKTTTAVYNPDGTRQSITDPLGRITTFAYNGLRQVTSVTEPRRINNQPIVRSITYDTAGNIQTESAPLLDQNGTVVATATTTYHHDDPSHPDDVTSVTDPNGNTSTYAYSPTGNLLSATTPATTDNPAGNRTTFAYDDRGWRRSTVSPRGNVVGGNPSAHTVTYDYDAYGRPTVTRDSLWTATTPTEHQVVNAYDADGNLTAITDGNNLTTSYVYNAAGEQTEIHRPDGTVLTSEYWPDGLLRRQLDGANQATTYDYDPVRHLSAITDPLNRRTQFVSDGVGNLTRVIDPSNRQTTNSFDAANQLIGITYSGGSTPNITNITYDANGQRTAMTDGTGTSTWAYDSLHRVTSATNGAGRVVGYGYDLGSRLTSITYPGTTGTVTHTYDNANRMTGVRDWANRLTSFDYDADSNVRVQTYPNGTRSTVSVDNANRVTGVSHAQTTSPSSPFARFDYAHDGGNRLTSVTSLGVPADNHTWSYDQINQLSSVDSAQYDYDAADNLTRLSSGPTQAFDTANQLTRTNPATISLVGTATGGTTNTTSVNLPLPAGAAANDLVVIAVSLSNGKTVTTPAGYTLVGTFPSGTRNTDSKVVIFRRTLAAGDTSVVVPFQGKFAKTVTLAVYRGVHPTLPILAASSGTTAAGTTVTSPSINATVLGTRLLWVGGTAATSGNWTAPAGMTLRAQRVTGSTDSVIADQALTVTGHTGSRTGTHSTSSKLVGIAVALRPAGGSYTFDSQGNRTSVTAENGTATALAYDQANRLTGYGPSASYTYNGDGLRATKTVAGVSTGFTWSSDGAAPVLLTEGTTNYIYGPGGLPLEQVDSSGAVLYYHHDQLGSTRALTNESGAVVATYSYDAYGAPAGSTGTVTNPLRFAGEYTDSESGYVYLRARYYDPATGQFISRDPMAAITRQPYTYAGNSPTNLTDPTGMCPWCVVVLIGVVIGAGSDLAGQVVENAIQGCDLFDDIDWNSAIFWGAVGGGTAGLGNWWAGGRAASRIAGAADDVATNLHHTVPREILRQLPDDVANNPLVRGRAGFPNRWPIPEDVHVAIHTGRGGGAYNQAWMDELANLGRAPTVDDVVRLRDEITKQFGIDVYRP